MADLKFILRIAIGSIVCILTVALLTMIIFFIASGEEFRQATALYAGGISAIVAFWAVLLWGLPIHLFLNWLNKRKFMWYAIAAIIPGPSFILFSKPFGENDFGGLINQSILCSGLGLLGAYTFWYLSVREK